MWAPPSGATETCSIWHGPKLIISQPETPQTSFDLRGPWRSLRFVFVLLAGAQGSPQGLTIKWGFPERTPKRLDVCCLLRVTPFLIPCPWNPVFLDDSIFPSQPIGSNQQVYLGQRQGQPEVGKGLGRCRELCHALCVNKKGQSISRSLPNYGTSGDSLKGNHRWRYFLGSCHVSFPAYRILVPSGGKPWIAAIPRSKWCATPRSRTHWL